MNVFIVRLDFRKIIADQVTATTAMQDCFLVVDEMHSYSNINACMSNSQCARDLFAHVL